MFKSCALAARTTVTTKNKKMEKGFDIFPIGKVRIADKIKGLGIMADGCST